MNENKTFTKRVTEEWEDFWSAKFIIKIIVVLLFVGLVWISYNELFRIPSIKEKVANLEGENDKKASEIQRLETLLVPFKTIALEKYTGSEQEAVQKLAKELSDLKNKADKIEERLAPRSLSRGQILKLAEQIKRHKNTIARLEYVISDPEAKSFAGQLKAALQSGGWIIPENDTAVLNPSFPVGINLYARNVPTEILESLRLILQEFGFAAKIGEEENLPENIILIRIGGK